MSLHKRPLDSSPSALVVSWLEANQPSKSLPILDLACGYGRNSLYLERQGFSVVAADRDSQVFSDKWFRGFQVQPLILSGDDHLPFSDLAFGAIVVVHYFSPSLFARLKRLVADGGFIVFESVGAHGGNWSKLPKTGEASDELGGMFEFLYKNERPLRGHPDRATIRLIAKRDSTSAGGLSKAL